MNYRKTLAVLTALAACASVAAMPAGVQNNDNTSIFAVEAAEAAKLEEGSLGDKVGFVIYDNGEMVITGSGAITKTTEDIKNRESVTSIVTLKGVPSSFRTTYVSLVAGSVYVIVNVTGLPTPTV